jgi:hypothetical protein
MELRSRSFPSYGHSRPVIPCAQCGKTLFAPEWSEYLEGDRVRHLWGCTGCGYEFETTVHFHALGTQSR